MDEQQAAKKLASDTVEWMIQFAKQTTEPYKEGWAERRETAKTLISLTSAALIFTITFSSSIISAPTPKFWRYTILACWIAFICSLAAALGSIWFSMGLSALPIRIDERSNAIQDASTATLQTLIKHRIRLTAEDATPVSDIFEQQLVRIARQDLAVHWLLRISIMSFGVALFILTAIGIRQLLR